MRVLILVLLVLGLPAAAQDVELEISFYLQPDGSGQNTRNKSIELDDGEVTIEESGEDSNRYVERAATPEEIALITGLIKARFAAMDFTGAPRLDPPYIEVQFEFDGNIRKVEVEEVYPLGALPPAYLALQRRFFEDVFE